MDIGSRIDAVFDRFKKAMERKPEFETIADNLMGKFGGEDVAGKENITKALLNLAANRLLPLPSGGDIDSLVNTASSALDLFLEKSERSDLVGANNISARAIKLLNKKLKVDPCGGNTKGNPPPGPDLAQRNGRHVVVYYLEFDENELPRLPKIKGDSRFAQSRLKPAFDAWEGELKLDVVTTDNPEQANLLITGRTFGSEVAAFGGESVLALTDVGPPNGQQLRMVFDLAEDDLTMSQFQATAAHEFGHALGVKHAFVDKTGDLMSPMLSQISTPSADDINAAVKHGGWVKS